MEITDKKIHVTIIDEGENRTRFIHNVPWLPSLLALLVVFILILPPILTADT